jgi:hypothetical protein
MIRLGVIVFLFLCNIGAFAQDSLTNNILTTKKFRKGIYVTFKDFKENNPSITAGYTVKRDSGQYERYKLYFNSGKKVRRVYGFSDGEGVYVNARVYDQTNYFVPIVILGQIVYFDDFAARRNVEAATSGLSFWFGVAGGVVAYTVASSNARKNPGWIIYMPDNDGNVYLLERKTVSSIFEDADHDLFL